jgi:transposase
MSSTGLPEPDPAVGAEAMSQAAEARRTATRELEEGALTLEELLVQVDEEDSDQLGHMHVRHALLALPHIGEVRADRILAEAGVDGMRHLASLGSRQAEHLVELAALYQGQPAE